MVEITFAEIFKGLEKVQGVSPYYDPTNSARKYISLRERRENLPGLLSINCEFWSEFTDYNKFAGEPSDDQFGQFLNPALASSRTTDIDNWIALQSAEFQRKVELKQDQVVKSHTRLTSDCENERVYKFVPTLDELPPQVRDLSPSDIVTLFDTPELEMFLLWLARVLVGPNNVWPLGFDSPLAHAMRIAICIYSSPGTGKSTLMSELMNAVSMTGYRTVNFQNLTGRFNNGSVFASDLAFIDDLTVRGMKDFLTAPSFKSAVTGALMKVEDKNRDAVQVKSSTAFAVCVNDIDTGVFTYELDAGVADRFKVLECVAHPTEHQVERLHRLSRELDVPIHVLMWRLCRHAVDLFLSKFSIGNEREFQVYVKTLSYSLKFQILKNFTQSLVDYIVLAHWLRHGAPPVTQLNPDSFVHLMRDFVQLSVSESNREYRNTLKELWLQNERSDTHVWYAQHHVSLPTLVTSWQHLQTVLSLNPKTSVKKLVHEAFATIYSKQGTAAECKYQSIQVMFTRASLDTSRFTHMIESLSKLSDLTPNWTDVEPKQISHVLSRSFNPTNL